MQITATLVKELRNKTGAGMMDCKKALGESDGDMEKAVEYLRKKGAATASKRSDRTANEGVVLTDIDNGNGIMVEVNCETDFVARSDDFINFAKTILDGIKSEHPADVASLLEKTIGDITLQTALTETIGKIGEKIEIKRFTSFESNGLLTAYIHPGSKLGVMLELDAQAGEETNALAKDLAMQIAAMNPAAIDRDSISDEFKEKELELYREQAREQGKPDNIIDRIAEGKLNKYFQEFTLLEQSYLKDTTKTVKEKVADVGKAVDHDIKIRRFERFQVGA